MDDFPSKIVHHSANSPESKLLGFPIRKKHMLAKQASPVEHVTIKMPPFIHFHGTKDPLVPYNQSLILHKRLLSFGNSSTLISIKNGEHNMPGKFTEDFVIPFLDYHFHNIGKAPQDISLKIN